MHSRDMVESWQHDKHVTYNVKRHCRFPTLVVLSKVYQEKDIYYVSWLFIW